ncbi:hypothetical protein B0H13DRAFT_1458810, partial [Mycena leptocephala]
MVWGIIAKGVKGPLIVLEYPKAKGGGMTSARYIKQVLESPLLDFFIQQDGAPSHRATATIKCESHRIPIFPHPPSSPDVSPID